MRSKILCICVLFWISAVLSFADEEITFPDREAATHELRSAAIDGRSRSVERALKFGALPNDTDEYGTTPLILASVRGHERVVRILLDAGADPNATSDDYASPIVGAAANCNDRVVSLLLRSGANPNTKSLTRQTPLMRAAENGCGTTVKELLKARNIDLRAVDESGKSAMDYAQAYGWTTVDYGDAWVQALTDAVRNGEAKRNAPITLPVRRAPKTHKFTLKPTTLSKR